MRISPLPKDFLGVLHAPRDPRVTMNRSEDRTGEVIGAAIEVHRVVRPGKLEHCYQAALEHELALRKIPFQTQVPIAMQYKGAAIGGFFADVIVDEKVILELKASRDVRRTHRPQLLSYLHWTGLRLGLLINFDVPVLVHGVRRVVY